MGLQLKKAERKQVKLRLNLSAPSGAGKTMSALRMAKGLVGNWEKIAVVDTENGSASLYSHLGDFNTIALTPPFTPEKYIEALEICAKSGMEAVILDSTSHEWWTLLEENENLAQAKYRGNTWAAWSQTTPRHDRFVRAVLHSPFHVITCTRSKTETIQEGGKVKKIGMKDEQRQGWEYELTVSLEIDRDTHMAVPSKDRTNLFEGKQPFIITEDTGELIKDWCETGAKQKTPEEKLNEATTLAELANVYTGFTKIEKEQTLELKDKLKSKFESDE
tara:strand:+ start:681 stop:1508 length:828 start_codon:yes stop_codon:yes gene_type:complete